MGMGSVVLPDGDPKVQAAVETRAFRAFAHVVEGVAPHRCGAGGRGVAAPQLELDLTRLAAGCGSGAVHHVTPLVNRPALGRVDPDDHRVGFVVPVGGPCQPVGT